MALNISVIRILLVIGILVLLLILILLFSRKKSRKEESHENHDIPKTPPQKFPKEKIPMKGLIESFDNLDRIKDKIRIQKRYVLENQTLA